ncbi:phage protease [Tropicibacter sp. S64]|uniref:phage protease n=1 Tax=Tropicibacter sp. S64 TaxID=3415122 RepID=UPI003C7B6541
MNNSLNTVALSAVALPDAAVGAVPEWIRLVPKGGAVAYDGRGGFTYRDAAKVIEASFAFSPRIHIDVNHATETAAKAGLASEAQGYILEMVEREDGIWGKVDWNASGQALMADRRYWGVSPVLFHNKDTKEIVAIKNVALTNDPAERRLVVFSAKETDGMDILAELAEMLGLPSGASADDVKAAIKKMKGGGDSEATAALQAVATALGAQDGAGQAELVTMVAALQAKTDQVVALQARVEQLETDGKAAASEAWLQSMLQAGYGIPSTQHDTLRDLHAQDAARADGLAKSFPKLGKAELAARAAPPATEISALSATQKGIAQAMGVSEETYLARLQAEAKAEEV